jgi:hypothetical protein
LNTINLQTILYKRSFAFAVNPFARQAAYRGGMKMTSRAALTVLLLLSLGTRAGTGEEQKHNGYWWEDTNRSFKLGFVTGFAMAGNSAGDMLVFECLANKHGGVLPTKAPPKEELIACSQEPVPTAFDYSQILLGQLADGIDEFYNDFRNKNVPASLAIRYVRDQLKGKPAKELEDELTAWRKVTILQQ